MAKIPRRSPAVSLRDHWTVSADVHRHGVALAALVTLALLTGCTVEVGSDQQGRTLNGTVTNVVDGDTVDVRLANGTTERVRLLGIDTPEVHVAVQPAEYEGVPDTEAGRECLRAAGENASQRVTAWIDGEQVALRLDPRSDGRGSYGRLLAIVVHGNESVNLQLLEEGHARLYDTEFSQRDRYADAEEAAMAADSGVWRCRNV